MRRVLLVLALCAGVVCSAAGNLDDGLVGRWRFDEGQGTQAADAGKNGNRGTLKGGAEWTAEGISGGALRFNGTDSYVEIPSGETMNLKMLTMSAWVNAEKVGGIMCFSTGAGWVDERAVIHFYDGQVLPSGHLRFTVSDALKYTTTAAGSPLTLNEWVHVAVTYDGKVMRIFQNGLLVAEGANSAITPMTGGVPLKIGRCEGLAPNFFTGRIDEVRLYNRSLSAQEIEKLAREFAR